MQPEVLLQVNPKSNLAENERESRCDATRGENHIQRMYTVPELFSTNPNTGLNRRGMLCHEMIVIYHSHVYHEEMKRSKGIESLSSADLARKASQEADPVLSEAHQRRLLCVSNRPLQCIQHMFTSSSKSSSIARLMCGSRHWSLRCRPPQVCALYKVRES